MVGQTISQYRVEEEFGRGGRGVVYRAYDLQLRREVAIKLLAAEIAIKVVSAYSPKRAAPALSITLPL